MLMASAQRWVDNQCCRCVLPCPDYKTPISGESSDLTSKQLTLDSKHLMREAERKFSNARIAFSEILHVGNNTNSNVNITIDEVNNEMPDGEVLSE